MPGKFQPHFPFLPSANDSCGKIMFLHLSVILFTGVGRCTPPQVHPPTDTPQADTPPPGHTPPGQTSTPRRPLQRTVCILLECILVKLCIQIVLVTYNKVPNAKQFCCLKRKISSGVIQIVSWDTQVFRTFFEGVFRESLVIRKNMSCQTRLIGGIPVSDEVILDLFVPLQSVYLVAQRSMVILADKPSNKSPVKVPSVYVWVGGWSVTKLIVDSQITSKPSEWQSIIKYPKVGGCQHPWWHSRVLDLSTEVPGSTKSGHIVLFIKRSQRS